MEFSGEGVGVYAEAKGEYTRQLCQYLSSALQSYFLNLLETAKEQEKETRKHLLAFQTLLEGISEWNIDKVQRETQRIAISTQCDYLEELLTAVFIAHTKVLSAIRLTNKQKKLQITIPKLEHFLHRTMTECARLLWTNTYLFAGAGTSIDRQKNMRQIETIINEGILQGVRSMLPVKSILREYLTTDDGGETDTDGETDAEEEEEEEEEEESDEKEEAKEEVKEAKETKEEAKEEPVVVAAPSTSKQDAPVLKKEIFKPTPSKAQPLSQIEQAFANEEEVEVDNSDETTAFVNTARANTPVTKNTAVSSPVIETTGPKTPAPTIFVDTASTKEPLKFAENDDEHINIIDDGDEIPFDDDGGIGDGIDFETL